jgi:hypothetical protein
LVFPTKQVSLDEVVSKSGGINPFDVPDNVSPNDDRLQRLGKSGFSIGIMLQMGIPCGHTPATLPPIVTFITPSKVEFNLFCRQVKVFSLKPGWGGALWSVVSQPVGGQPWSMKMTVDLTLADLDAELDTPYFKNAKEHGLSLVAVTAVAQPEDKSSLHMTDFERIVHRLKDSTGRPIPNPTLEQAKVTTLDYLCVVNNHPRPQIDDLVWNWMQPGDVGDSSGVIAINRNTLTQCITDPLIAKATYYCRIPVIGPIR